MNVNLQASRDPKSSLTNHMKRLMDETVASGFRRYSSGETWRPSVNLYEDKRACYIVVDLAGVDYEKIDIRVHNGMLEMTGDRETPRPPEIEGFAHLHLMEIDHGTFCRKIHLPATIDTDRISAVYSVGYLWIDLPKKGTS